MALRPYWSGQLRLSLVSLPVNIYSALNRARQHVTLHEIHRPSGQRVHHQLVAHAEPVLREDIVKGYEYEKGQYVLLEPHEISALKIPSKETLDIVQFVDAADISPTYFTASYYVAPDGRAAIDAYAVIREALHQIGKVGLGQLAVSGREHLCMLSPYNEGMLLETLHYADEVRQAGPYFADIGETKIDKEELELAKELIRRKTAKFEPEKFHDHYREALQELIDAKIGHRKPREVVEAPPPGRVINLMDALRKSLNQSATGKYSSQSKSAKSSHSSKPRSTHGRTRR